jgi:hypothetical protein
MSTGHQGDYGNTIMQKRGLLPRPDQRDLGAKHRAGTQTVIQLENYC